MKKSFLVLTLAILTFGACIKKQSTEVVTVTDTVYTDTPDIPKPIDTNLTISGIRDLRTTVWGSAFMDITVDRNKGEKKKVNMNISGMP